MLIRAFLEWGEGYKQKYYYSFWLWNSSQRKPREISEHVSIRFNDFFFSVRFNIRCLFKGYLKTQHMHTWFLKIGPLSSQKESMHTKIQVVYGLAVEKECFFQGLLQEFCFRLRKQVLPLLCVVILTLLTTVTFFQLFGCPLKQVHIMYLEKILLFQDAL